MSKTTTTLTETQETAELRLELKHFTGTLEYHFVNALPMVVTDGVLTFAHKAGAYWLLDVIGSHWGSRESRARIPDHSFQVWRITVSADMSAVVRCGDGLGSWSIMQAVELTDFPFASFDLWALPGARNRVVVMLPSEY